MALLDTKEPTGVSRRPAGWCRAWLFALAILFATGTTVYAQPAPAREYQIKAVFLFNFVQFGEWPATAFPDAAAPIVIGVLGDDPFGSSLEEAVRGEAIRGRPLAIRRYRRVEEVENCQVLFISNSESSRIETILTRLNGRNILTVGDLEGFASRGGMIRFVTENKKIRFHVNLEAVRAAGLVLSSKLLRSAEIVSNEGGKP
jgi:hypothetical protein